MEREEWTRSPSRTSSVITHSTLFTHRFGSVVGLVFGLHPKPEDNSSKRPTTQCQSRESGGSTQNNSSRRHVCRLCQPPASCGHGRFSSRRKPRGSPESGAEAL